MKAFVKTLVARSLRHAGRTVLQRPWLKKHARDMLKRMPGLHGLMLRVMFQAPAPARQRDAVHMQHLTPDARRVHRALRQAIRTHRR